MNISTLAPRNLFQALFTAAWTAVWVTVAIVLLAFTWNRHIPLWMARHIWSAGLLRMAGIRLEVSGLEGVDFSKPHVFVANHESMIDIPVVFRALPVNLHFILKKELQAVPFIGWFAWATGMIFVDRKNRAGAISSLRRVGRIIRGGRSVIAYPEGTRSRGRGLLPFKKGVFVAAIEAGVPVVPVAIIGAEAAMPCGTFCARPGTIVVRVGRPIATHGLTLEDRQALPDQARMHILELFRTGFESNARTNENQSATY